MRCCTVRSGRKVVGRKSDSAKEELSFGVSITTLTIETVHRDIKDMTEPKDAGVSAGVMLFTGAAIVVGRAESGENLVW